MSVYTCFKIHALVEQLFFFSFFFLSFQILLEDILGKSPAKGKAERENVRTQAKEQVNTPWMEGNHASKERRKEGWGGEKGQT